MSNLKEKSIFAVTIFWGLAFSILVTILLAIPLFYIEIPIYGLTDIAHMSTGTLIHNFNVLMNYLLSPFVSHLNMPNFPSSAHGLQHFREVKNLFMLVLAVSVCLIPAPIFFVRKKLTLFFETGLKITMIAPILVAAFALLVGFNNFFIYFHEVLFRDNTWLFDPAVDPIINVLPEAYFMHTFILFAFLYEALFLFFYFKNSKNNMRENDTA